MKKKITNIEENANHLEKLSAFKTASTKLITDRQKFDKQNEFLLKRENVLVKEKMKLKESEAKLLQLQRDFDKQFSIIKRYLVPEDFAFTEILLLIKSHHLNCNEQKGTFPFVFLSYGWNTDENKNKELQEWLLKLKRDLTLAGITVFLDIRNMQLNLTETIQTNIEKSDYILIACTPRLKERAEEQSTNPNNINNLQIELTHIRNKNKTVLPLLIEGDYTSSLLTNPIMLKKHLVYDFTKNSYYDLLIHYNPKGIIPVLLNESNNDNYTATYSTIVDKFDSVLKSLRSLRSN